MVHNSNFLQTGMVISSHRTGAGNSAGILTLLQCEYSGLC